MAAVSKKEQDARIEKERELLVQKLSMSISFKDWRRAAEAGIDKADSETDEYVGNIMLAYKASKGEKSFDELTEMGMGELTKIIFPEHLLPEDIKALL